MTDAHPPHQQAPEPAPEPVPGAAPESQTEVLFTGSGRRRRIVAISVVAALVVGVLASGAWAAYAFLFGGGPRPEEALPASTVAVVSIDLDPSAGQKIAAIKAIRKFPSLKKSLGLDTDDDLRRFLFDKAVESGDCGEVDFEKDVKPWIGKRAAFAAVDLGDDEPAPAIALQITDRDKARTGFSRVADCAGAGEDFRWSIGEDYLIASDSQEHADEIRRDGERKPLADDALFQRWHDEAGDAGVVNFYVSARVTRYLSDLLDGLSDEVFGGSDSAFDGRAYSGDAMSGLSAPRGARSADDPDPLAGVREELDKFAGMAGTVRFAGGGMELSVAAGGLSGAVSASKVGEQVAELPGNTAFALGFGISKAFSDAFADGFVNGFTAAVGGSSDDAIADFEDQTGLKLPEDITTLLGDSLILSIGGDAPRDLADIESFADVPVGLVIHGDAAKIKDLISRFEDRSGYRLSDIPLVVGGDDDTVVLTPSQDYAEELSKAGSLGRRPGFVDAVPQADRARGITYLDFNSAWRETLLRFAGDDGASARDVREADENTEPLKSLGVSSWLDGKVAHLLVTIATD